MIKVDVKIKYDKYLEMKGVDGMRLLNKATQNISEVVNTSKFTDADSCRIDICSIIISAQYTGSVYIKCMPNNGTFQSKKNNSVQVTMVEIAAVHQQWHIPVRKKQLSSSDHD
jgi:hypothetical protein